MLQWILITFANANHYLNQCYDFDSVYMTIDPSKVKKNPSNDWWSHQMAILVAFLFLALTFGVIPKLFFDLLARSGAIECELGRIAYTFSSWSTSTLGTWEKSRWSLLAKSFAFFSPSLLRLKPPKISCCSYSRNVGLKITLCFAVHFSFMLTFI